MSTMASQLRGHVTFDDGTVPISRLHMQSLCLMNRALCFYPFIEQRNIDLFIHDFPPSCVFIYIYISTIGDTDSIVYIFPMNASLIVRTSFLFLTLSIVILMLYTFFQINEWWCGFFRFDFWHPTFPMPNVVFSCLWTHVSVRISIHGHVWMNTIVGKWFQPT